MNPHKPLKIVIAGSRDLTDFETVKHWIVIGYRMLPGYMTELVSGTADGVDKIGEQWAGGDDEVTITRFPADWKKYGKSAGPRRNRQMAKYADAAVVLINNRSNGSMNMFNEMYTLGKPCVAILFNNKRVRTILGYHLDGEPTKRDASDASETTPSST